MATSGARSGTNEYTMDGAPNTGAMNGSVGYVPPMAVVEEFKIQTATFDASNGYSPGSAVNVSLKSGTNKAHGTAYFGKETAGLNANNFFANAAGTKRANLNLSNPGGTFSGPVLLPKVYDGRNRTFFLFGYNWVKSVASGGTAGGIVATVPTEA